MTMGPMRLKAVDGDDLRVISALLQDAIIAVSDMAFLPDDRLFALLVSRFVWEGLPPDGGPTPDLDGETPLRIRCAVLFKGVDQVRRRELDLTQRGRFLSLLSIEPVEGALLLRLSGGADIRLQGAAVECWVEDQGEPWPVGSLPDHGLT